MKVYTTILVSVLILQAFIINAQTEDQQTEDRKPTRPHYESSWLIENQSVLVPKKNTLELMIQHRFGEVSSGSEDLWGIYLPSNIRLGLNYTALDNVGFGKIRGPVSFGYGTTRDGRIHDFNMKYAMMSQTTDNVVPVSITYFTNMAIEAEKSLEELPNQNRSDRYSFFHQLILSRRVSSALSVQLAPTLSHYNVVSPYMNNDHFSIGIGGRLKFSPQSEVLFNMDQPITTHEFYNPQPTVSFGLGVGTSSHAFQVFMTNARFLIPQRNSMYNQNDPWQFQGNWFLGFNITRKWNY